MNIHRLAGLALAALATLPPAAAEDTVAAGPWTLDRCLEYALAHNLQVQKQRIAVQQSEVDVYAAKGKFAPSLSFATSQGVSWRPWSNSYVNISNGTMTHTTSEVNYNGSYGLSAQWELWNGGRNYRSYKRALRAVDQSRAQTAAAELDIEEKVAQAYVQILYQMEDLEVNRRVLASTHVQAERAAEMVAVGTMSRADLAQMEAQLSQQEYNTANALTQLSASKLSLKQTLQIVDSGDFDVAPPDSLSDAAATAPLPTVESLYAAALACRPEVAASRIGVELARMDVDLAKRQRYPTIGMNAGINTSNTSGMDTGFFNQLKTNLSNSIGVSVSVPIFDNRSASSAIKRAELADTESRLQLDDVMTALYNDVEQLWLNADNATQQYAYAKVNAEAMQVSYDLVSVQFAVGLKDIVDLNTARSNLLQARQQMLQAKYTSLLNRALLRFYSGAPLSL